MLAGLFMGHTIVVAAPSRAIPPPDRMTFAKSARARHLIPVVALIVLVLGSIYVGVATATEAAALGIVGALALSWIQGSMTWKVFMASLMGATRLYCMIAFILAGAAFLTLAMGYIGLPRHLAEYIGGLGLSQLWLLFWLMVFTSSWAASWTGFPWSCSPWA